MNQPIGSARDGYRPELPDTRATGIAAFRTGRRRGSSAPDAGAVPAVSLARAVGLRDLSGLSKNSLFRVEFFLRIYPGYSGKKWN